jgi:phage baseplate assembly protein W
MTVEVSYQLEQTNQSSAGLPTGPASPAEVLARVRVAGGAILRPFRRDLKNDFARGRGNPLLASRIGQILGTEEGELEYDSAFGSRLHLIRHRNLDETTQELARFYVEEPLRRLEPEARVTRVTVEKLAGGKGLLVHVKFVPVDKKGNAVGPEESVAVPVR